MGVRTALQLRIDASYLIDLKENPFLGTTFASRKTSVALADDVKFATMKKRIIDKACIYGPYCHPASILCPTVSCPGHLCRRKLFNSTIVMT